MGSRKYADVKLLFKSPSEQWYLWMSFYRQLHFTRLLCTYMDIPLILALPTYLIYEEGQLTSVHECQKCKNWRPEQKSLMKITQVCPEMFGMALICPFLCQ